MTIPENTNMKKEISCLVWGITEDVRWQEAEVDWWLGENVLSFEQMCEDKYNSSVTEKLKGKEKDLVNEENKSEKGKTTQKKTGTRERQKGETTEQVRKWCIVDKQKDVGWRETRDREKLKSQSLTESQEGMWQNSNKEREKQLTVWGKSERKSDNERKKVRVKNHKEWKRKSEFSLWWIWRKTRVQQSSLKTQREPHIGQIFTAWKQGREERRK